MGANEEYFRRQEELRKQLDEGFPEAWKPKEPGETLIGIFVGRDTGHTQYGPKYIVVLEDVTSHEKTAVWLLHTALESQFRRAAPAIGELVAIRYEGKVTPQSGGAQYDNWTVKVDRPKDTRLDWGQPAGNRSTDANQGSTAPVSDAPPPGDDDIPF